MNKKAEIINLEDKNSILNRFVAELRDINIQGDSLRFRENLSRIGQIMAYEVSQRMSYDKRIIKTPLGEKEVNLHSEEPVIGTILRAGLPFHEGMLRTFDKAESAFIAACREYSNKTDFVIKLSYAACPDLTNKTLILSDPMLASGASMVQSYRQLLVKGVPAHTHIVSIIAAQEGVDFVAKELKDFPITIWSAAIDPHLNAKGYIIPGLGDAGDLAYGDKL